MVIKHSDWSIHAYHFIIIYIDMDAKDIELSIFSVNVRGLHNYQKCKCIFEWFTKIKYDFIGLQETFCTNSDINIYDSRLARAKLSLCNGLRS